MLYPQTAFLPFVLLCLLLYWRVCPPAQRGLFLAASSLAWLAWLALRSSQAVLAGSYLFGMVVLAALVFAGAARLRRRPSLCGMWLLVLLALTPLLGFKYLHPVLAQYGWPAWIVPLGISYYSFKHVHFIVESQRGQFEGARWRDYLAFVCFFPMYVAGPIERFGNFASQLNPTRLVPGDLSIGLERILMGLFKKLVLADLLLAELALQPDMPGQAAALALDWRLAWLGCVLRFLQTYCDFSAYSDMAIGMARLFGIRLMENFHFPLLRPNLAEFWRGWHISLSSFARDYVYFPMLARWNVPSLALILTMLTTGLWHAGNPGWLLWGLHHGVGLVVLGKLHRLATRWAGLQTLRDSLPWRILATVITWLYVSLGYALTLYPQDWGAARLYLHIISMGTLA